MRLLSGLIPLVVGAAAISLVAAAPSGGPADNVQAFPFELLETIEEGCGIDTSAFPAPTVRTSSEIRRSSDDEIRPALELYSVLGLTDASPSELFAQYRQVRQEAGSFYDAASNEIVVTSYAGSDLDHRRLSHEYVHAWQHHTFPGSANEVASIDAELTRLAVEEGLAEYCANAYLDSLPSGRREALADTIANQHSSLGFALDTALARSAGWSYQLGLSYFRTQADKSGLERPTVPELSDRVPAGTDELLGYESASRERELGALLLREMLISSGIHWSNADQVSEQVETDTMILNRTHETVCLQLEITFSGPDSTHVRFLDRDSSLERWAAATEANLTHTDADRVTIERCVPR